MDSPFLSSPAGTDPVIIEGNFAAPPERVFRAWTDPHELSQWFGTSSAPPEVADIDCRVGGNWQFTFVAEDGSRDTMQGEYVAVEPGRRLVFSWIHQRTSRDGDVTTTPSSQVTVTFEPMPGGSRVRLVHELIVKESGRLGVSGGWSASFARLAQLLVR